MYNIYETIPPLDTTWYTIWAKVIVIVATYRRVVTVGLFKRRNILSEAKGVRRLALLRVLDPINARRFHLASSHIRVGNRTSG